MTTTTTHPAVGDVYVTTYSGERFVITEVDAEGNVRTASPTGDWVNPNLMHPANFNPSLGLVTLVEPYVCGTCGYRFYEETPAGRCPREYDHEEPTDPIFRVYAIADGAVDGEDWEGDDYTDALLEFSRRYVEYTEARDRGQLDCEVTLHLYEPAWGNLLHERTITRTVD